MSHIADPPVRSSRRHSMSCFMDALEILAFDITLDSQAYAHSICILALIMCTLCGDLSWFYMLSRKQSIILFHFLPAAGTSTPKQKHRCGGIRTSKGFTQGILVPSLGQVKHYFCLLRLSSFLSQMMATVACCLVPHDGGNGRGSLFTPPDKRVSFFEKLSCATLLLRRSTSPVGTSHAATQLYHIRLNHVQNFQANIIFAR